ncbi:aldehyde dehydrogenase (NAD+) [Trichoderma harzianum]|uniref:aldehyde dehydrogenase (NAD(+)) n=1 Tax=Trichoderma harzianum TaxID=5544 RepID=A0A0F9WVA9_TRIHA|nr:aldehyde dehydrogenase (NAD+) [Trichoderma harzianum]
MSSINITLPNGIAYEQPVGLFINNAYKHASGDEFQVVDPSTAQQVLSVRGASVADIDEAVDAARKAFQGPWSEFTPAQRGDALVKLASLIDRDRKLIAAIDAYDCGKPYSVALEADLDESYNVFKYYAGWADKIYGDTIDTSPTKLAYTLQEPLGVCGQIIPWNFPFMMLAWKVAPALACGNVVIVKPAEQTPLSAMYFGKLVQEAGLPPGVVSIVPGLGPVAGKALAEHTQVDKIAFTGSTNTGRAIMRSAASNLKNITLECGGKSPLIIFKDAALDQAVKWAHVGIMDNSGQVCTSTSRIYVHEKVYDEFVTRFTEFTNKSTVIGNPFKDDVNHGPQVSKTQFDRILSYIEAGRKEGAKILSGGAKVDGEGYYIQPTIFTETDENATIVRDEIFGPVVVINKFATEAEAVAKANDTSYGLAAALFTENISRGHTVARKLQAGMVWINSSGDSHFGIPFGGYKSSGIGRELGRYALDAYTQTKAIHINLGTTL